MITKAKSRYVRLDTKLAQFCETANSEFWDEKWLKRSEANLRRALRQNASLSSHSKFFAQWLSTNDLILEAGCGSGLWVRRLIDHGYRCVGVDYAIQSLQRTRKIIGLPLIGGDIFSLPLPSNSIGTYLSFGVIEHFQNGIQKALREAYRVLKPGGYALISVPYENPYRQKKISVVSEFIAKDMGLEFYQYYFRPTTILNELTHAGFVPITNTVHFYGVHIGIREAFKAARVVLSKLPYVSLWAPALDRVLFLSYRWGHMMFTVSRKPE